jgi:hypothetical protein
VSLSNHPIAGPDRQGQGTMGHTMEAGFERIRDHFRRPHPHTMNTTDQIRSTVFLIDPQAANWRRCRAGDRLLLASVVDQTERLGGWTVCRSGQGLMSAPALGGRRRNADCRPGRCANWRDGASMRWRQLSGQIRVLDLSA